MDKEKKNTEKKINVQNLIENLVRKAQIALDEMMKLNQEDIDKIVNTYINREEIDKYSHRASLEEIKENDFNLNIPRYVDTFEEEEPVDLDEVCKELEKISEEMKEVDAEIKKYCDELGIKAPLF